MSQERNPCYISSFRIGFDIYEHQIFPQERDQVELVSEKGETLLEFTNDLFVKDKSGTIGYITREGESWVYYERPLQTRVAPSRPDKGLLGFEVEISKRYLMANRYATVTESEGGLCD